MYPTKKQHTEIKKWNHLDFINLVEFIKPLWCYNDFIRVRWENHKVLGWRYIVTFITGGDSGNEYIINALLKNRYVELFYYSKWERGGLHEFTFSPQGAGYKLASDFCKENSISRQAIYKSKHKYKFIYIKKHTVFVKPLNE